MYPHCRFFLCKLSQRSDLERVIAPCCCLYMLGQWFCPIFWGIALWVGWEIHSSTSINSKICICCAGSCTAGSLGGSAEEVSWHSMLLRPDSFLWTASEVYWQLHCGVQHPLETAASFLHAEMLLGWIPEKCKSLKILSGDLVTAGMGVEPQEGDNATYSRTHKGSKIKFSEKRKTKKCMLHDNI